MCQPFLNSVKPGQGRACIRNWYCGEPRTRAIRLGATCDVCAVLVARQVVRFYEQVKCPICNVKCICAGSRRGDAQGGRQPSCGGSRQHGACQRRGGNPPAPAFPRRGKRERGRPDSLLPQANLITPPTSGDLAAAHFLHFHHPLHFCG